MFASMLALLLSSPLIAVVATSIPTNDFDFVLPKSFLGSWIGSLDYSMFGPYNGNSYLFSISQAPNGDYVFENNIVYDELASMGYQRFYVEGTGATASNLWYCGKLTNYSDFEEVTGDDRLNGFRALKFPEEGDSSVTFCLDTDNTAVLNGGMNPFQVGCSHCDCANWTIAYDESTDALVSQLSMSGSEGHTHSKHVWVSLKRAGPAPVITDEDVPGHGDAFSCAFEENGRDSEPVDRGDSPLPSSSHHHHLPLSDSGTGGAGNGCPHMKRLQANKVASASPLLPALSENHLTTKKANKLQQSSSSSSSSSSYDHCYVINKYSDYRIAWSLDLPRQLLHVSVSAPPPSADTDNHTYVAVGFRPMSRSSAPPLAKQGTGRHMNFGMEGADIVAGSVGRGLRSLYAELYTGPPVVDTSLQLSDSSVEVVGGRVVVSFTRPLVGGYLYANHGSEDSIVSGYADIIWAVGLDTDSTSVSDGGGDDDGGGGGGGEAGCEYHSNTRGLRFMDWEDPTIAMVDAWKC